LGAVLYVAGLTQDFFDLLPLHAGSYLLEMRRKKIIMDARSNAGEWKQNDQSDSKPASSFHCSASADSPRQFTILYHIKSQADVAFWQILLQKSVEMGREP
jgi:hypothetical protein